MPGKSKKKRGSSKKLYQKANGKLIAKKSTTVANSPAQSSSEEPNVDLRRSKRLRKEKMPFQFQITALKRSPKEKFNKKLIVNTFEGVGDNVKLLNIFPEEIWMIILEKCTEPNAMENLSNASLYFRDRLFQNRVVFLFPSVWKILGNKYHENYEKHESGKGYDESFNPNRDALVSVRNPGTDNIFHGYSILKLRLVCHIWNQSIEHFYQYHPSHFNIKEQSKCIVSRTTKWPHLDGNSMGNFLLHFRNTHQKGGNIRNPFISRKVSLNVRLTDCDDAPGRWQHMNTFASSYGQHIWYIDLKIETFSSNSTAYMSFLQDFLNRMPNLKALCVDTGSTFLWTLSEEELRLFCFPKLQNLQFLSICEMPHFAQHKLERANLHVTKLEFHKFNYRLFGPFDEFSCPHPNLRVLAVNVDRHDDLKRLKLLTMNWKLTELTLNFSREMYDILWQDVFTLIENKWKNTLTVLSLKLPKAKSAAYQTKIMEECFSFRLNLSQVKNLTVVLTEFSSMDFILPLKSTLEELNVHIRFCYRFSDLACKIERGQEIQFLGYTTRPLESNIWQVFPNLKRFRIYEQEAVDIPIRCYSRHDWESWSERQKKMEDAHDLNQKQ